MGGGNYSSEHYQSKQAQRAASGQATFAHHAAMQSAPTHMRAAHASMDPMGVGIRESRDNADHPNSKGVIIGLDVTGSMNKVPVWAQADLNKLMGLLIRQGCLTDPQIMIMAIGDPKCDSVPLQVGQFESDIRIEENLTNLYLEGGGGGNNGEGYALGMYFAAHHTALDCLEKRGEKGYMFLVGDEKYHTPLLASEIKKCLGGEANDVPIKTIVDKLLTMYEVFYIQPNMTSWYKESGTVKQWKEILGERVLFLEDPHAICELIASTIGLIEGNLDHDGISTALAKEGLSQAAGAVGTALASIKSGGKSMKVASSGAASGLSVV